MTEAEWFACAVPEPLLRFLRNRAPSRKRRLLECACCRRVEHLVPGPEFGRAVRVTEDFADGRGSLQDVIDTITAIWRMAEDSRHSNNQKAADALKFWGEESREFATIRTRLILSGLQTLLYDQAEYDAMVGRIVTREQSAGRGPWEQFDITTWFPFGFPQFDGAVLSVLSEARKELCGSEAAAQVVAIRDIFGNPFRPIDFAREWRTETVVALARQMYEAREFSAMPILADALLDAGCDRADILVHCRDDGPHARGCWVADLVLGKE